MNRGSRGARRLNKGDLIRILQAMRVGGAEHESIDTLVLRCVSEADYYRKRVDQLERQLNTLLPETKATHAR